MAQGSFRMANIDSAVVGDSQSQRRDYLKLGLVNGVRPRLMSSLLDDFETPANVLAASRTQLNEVARIGPKMAVAID